MSNSGISNAVGFAVLQQCVSAELQVIPINDSNPTGEFVEISDGLVIYVCFLKGITEEKLKQLANSILNAKLSECTETNKRKSVIEVSGDVLIIPQATLGGKLRGKTMQYHTNLDKTEGLTMYEKFIETCQSILTINEKCNLKYGTYGNRQVLNLKTNGPYTHTVSV